MPRAGRALWGLWLAATVTGCQPSPPPGDTGLLAVRRPAYTAAGVEGCHLCHAGDFNRAIAATPHGDAANPAAPYGQHGCESCHGPGSFHVSRAHGGKGVPALTTFGSGPGASGREAQLAACGGCHHPAAGGRAAIGFAGSAHDFRYITCSTCHVVHAAAGGLADPAAQAVLCLECHRSMRERHPRLAGRTVEFDRHRCSRCHDVHPVKDA